jgi:hypothetical protein
LIQNREKSFIVEKVFGDARFEKTGNFFLGCIPFLLILFAESNSPKLAHLCQALSLGFVELSLSSCCLHKSTNEDYLK